MKTFIVANTLLGLNVTAFASAVLDMSNLSARGASGIQATLCNDFHGGKPCQTYTAQAGSCQNVDSTNAGYISSVKIPQSNEYCTFYNCYDCQTDGKNITVNYPGNVDLAQNYNFDNQVLSYSCQTTSSY